MKKSILLIFKPVFYQLCFGLIFLLPVMLTAQQGADFSQISESGNTENWITVKPNLKLSANQILETTVTQSGTNFELLNTSTDKLGIIHQRYQETYKGYPIEGAQIFFHGQREKVSHLNHSLSRVNRDLPAIKLTESDALTGLLKEIKATSYAWESLGNEENLKRIKKDNSATYYPKGKLVWIDKVQNKDYRLAYRFDVYATKPLSRKYYYVDVETGQTVRSFDRIATNCFEHDASTSHKNHVCAEEEGAHLATSTSPFADEAASGIAAYVDANNSIVDFTSDGLDGGGYRLRASNLGIGDTQVIHTVNANNLDDSSNLTDFTDDDNNWEDDPVAVSVHWGTTQTFNYYEEEHGRISYDNKGSLLFSRVHFRENYDNAFWDGTQMTYGDGGSSFTPLTSLDVVGHELTHGVTEFNGTGGLIYWGESGALNESFSDIFGAAIEFVKHPDGGDWLVGEDIALRNQALRNMENPLLGGDPKNYFGQNWVTTIFDNAGVHINSGVQNHWFYLLVDGGSGTNEYGANYSVTPIGLEDAAAIAYRNLTMYLTPIASYQDAENGSIQAAIDLFGADSPQHQAVVDAWCAVGVSAACNTIEVPANDDCANATHLEVEETCVGGGNYTTIGATISPETPTFTCAFSAGLKDVWFTVTIPESGNLVVETYNIVGGLDDMALQAYTGDCGELTPIACNEDIDAGNYHARIILSEQTPGTLIYLRTIAYTGLQRGDFGICAYSFDSPLNDACVNAIALPVDSTCTPLTYTNIGANASSTLPTLSCSSAGNQEDVWFTAIVPENGNLVIETVPLDSNGLADMAIQAYIGENCTALVEVACNDNADANSTHARIELIGETPGVEVYFRVVSNSLTQGNFGICAHSIDPPANDACADAIALTVGDTCMPAVFTNVDATTSPELPSFFCTNPGTLKDVWFTAVVPASGNLAVETVQIEGGLNDMSIQAYTGSCGTLERIACNGDIDGVNLHARIKLFDQVPGTVIYLRVISYLSRTQGSFGICATDYEFDPPVNDACANPIELLVDAACTPRAFYTNVDATTSPESPGFACTKANIVRDVWFTLTVPPSGNVIIQTSNLNNNSMTLQAYSGSCGELVGINCSTRGGIQLISQTPGSVIYVRVMSIFSAFEGEFLICAHDSGVTSSCPDDLSIPPSGPNGTPEGDLTLQASARNNSIASGIYQAANTITATGTLLAGNDATFKAGTSIDLTEGFTVRAGATFHAYMETCTLTLIEPEVAESRTLTTTVDIQEELDLQVAPNPVVHTADIRFYMPTESKARLMVLNLNGQILTEQVTEGIKGWNTSQLDASQLPAGMYLVVLRTEGQQLTEKIIIGK